MNEEILNRFKEAFEAAARAGEPEPSAMVLATTDTDFNLSTRAVLLKAIDQAGFVFYTNTLSNKGQQLRQVPRGSLTFLWKASLCQVHAQGAVERVTEAEADTYFATRSRDSQVGAWASRQSDVLESREVLDSRVRAFDKKFAGREVSRPPHWSGYRLIPEMVEFWHGRPARLHDRFRYSIQDGAWALARLYP